MTEPTRRQRRKVLTDKMVEALPRKRKRYILADPELRGHYVRVPVQGPCVFAAVARHQGKQFWATLGGANVLKIAEARDKAREAIKRIQQGLPAFEPAAPTPDSVVDVCAGWLLRHAEAKALRTRGELRRVLERHVLPRWRDRPFAEIRRSDVTKLLDDVEDRHGAWAADQVLAVLGSVAGWFAARNDDYAPPLIKGMRRVPAEARKRSRILSDGELGTVWRTAEAAGAFGAFILVLLLTAQRREKVATMRWDDLSEDGTWTIRTEPREKGNPGSLRLPPAALKVINAQPRMAGNPAVFCGRKDGSPLSGFSSRHAAFRASCAVDGWSLHDLRRTARSLMARAGVSTEIAERVLGHAIPGIEAVYNQHGYDREKAAALRKLAALITEIVDGKPGKVVKVRAAQP